MKRSFSIFISFVLFALMLLKVSSFHVYSHQDETSDDIENCIVCELAIENQNTAYVFTDSQIVKNLHPDITSLDRLISYDSVVVSSFLRFNFFGRPPPNLS